MATKRRPPSEIEVLRRLVAAQDRIMIAYRTCTRTPASAIDEATKCGAWLEQIDAERRAKSGSPPTPS